MINSDNSLHSNISYTWRKLWIHDYESPWGILQKFQFANSASYNDILNIFSISRLEDKIKCNSWSDRDKDLTNLSRLDGEQLINILGVNIKKENNKNIIALIDKLSDVYLKCHIINIDRIITKYIRSQLTYCPECIKDGYHSIFHQVTLINKCPFHLIDLISVCPNCNARIDYKICDKSFLEPFRCICGYWFLSNNTIKNFVTRWGIEPRTEIIMPELNLWLNLSEEQKKISRNIYFNSRLDKTQHNYLISEILTLMNILEFSEDKKYYKTTYTSLTKDKLSSKELENFPIVSLAEKEEEIFLSSCKTYSSILRYIRKKLLHKHKTCIKSLTIRKYVNNLSDIIVCPYAYAYTMLRKNLENLYRISDVDNKDNTRYWKKNYKYFSISFYDHILEDYIKSGYITNSKEIFHEVDNLTWIMDKVLGLFIINYYNYILRNATLLLSKGIVNSIEMDYELMPNFYFKVNDNKSNIECHCWSEPVEQEVDYECPFSSIKKRRKDKLDLNFKYFAIPEYRKKSK